MKQIHKTIPIPNASNINRYFSENSGFFDIETTGFSPNYAFVYLIGMAVRTKDTIHIHQFLAETRQEEKNVLAAFYKQSAPVHTLITFNGTRFDIPFLQSRETLHSIQGNWDSQQITDLYKLTAKLSRLFQLPDKKQKSIEKFLGIDREDQFTGGELIQIYDQYEKTKNPHAETLLLLHNYEDVLGMTKLLSLFAYRDFFELPPHVLSGTKDSNGIQLTLKAPMAFPTPFNYRKGYAALTCQNTSTALRIQALHGELNYYYENYKDYYYLPEEDMAIHKSVAAFVDPAHKKKATAATCYSKKSGQFLPQPENIFTPCFYPKKKRGTSYFELTEAFLSDQNALNTYAASLLNYIYSQKANF